jgi:hypothetical protein
MVREDRRDYAGPVTRRLLLLLLLVVSVAALGGDGGAPDGGVALTRGDAGQGDAGLADAGARDGGTPDTGPPKRARWSWVHADGGWLLDGGVSDVLSVSVGETAEVRFPHPIILMQCDEVLLSLSATVDTLLLKGEKAGHTQCGFWWFRQPFPNRMMDVTVAP